MTPQNQSVIDHILKMEQQHGRRQSNDFLGKTVRSAAQLLSIELTDFDGEYICEALLIKAPPKLMECHQ